jgi:hypothetical protein
MIAVLKMKVAVVKKIRMTVAGMFMAMCGMYQMFRHS